MTMLTSTAVTATHPPPHHNPNYAAGHPPQQHAMNNSTPKKEVKWAPGLGDPSDIHIQLVDVDMAWDDARLARVLRNDPYLSVHVSPQLPALVRSYECFADLHSQLLLAHPHESGRTGKMPRTLPFLPDWPAQLDRNTSHRLVRGLSTYLQELAGLPAHILHHQSVAKFCEPPPVQPVPQEPEPAQLTLPPPASSGRSSSNSSNNNNNNNNVPGNAAEGQQVQHRSWSTMSNASNSDPSLPRGRHPNGPPPRVTSTASSGLSLNLPAKHFGGSSSSVIVSPVNGSFQQQRTQRGTVFPRGSSLPSSPSSTVFPEYPPVPQPPAAASPADHQRSPSVQPADIPPPASRSDSPRFAPRSASQTPRDTAAMNDAGLSVPQRVHSREEHLMASSHTSSGISHQHQPPPSARASPIQPPPRQFLHHHASASEVTAGGSVSTPVHSPHMPPRVSSSDHQPSYFAQAQANGPPLRRVASSSSSSPSSSRPPSALPPPSPRIASGAPSPYLPPLTADPATPSVATPTTPAANAPVSGNSSSDKSLKIKLVFPKLNHVAAVRIRLDALTMGTLLTAVESKVDQAHAERARDAETGSGAEVPRPQQYTICYRVPESGKSVKVNNQTLPGIVREVVGRGEEKVVLYMLY